LGANREEEVAPGFAPAADHSSQSRGSADARSQAIPRCACLEKAHGPRIGRGARILELTGCQALPSKPRSTHRIRSGILGSPVIGASASQATPEPTPQVLTPRRPAGDGPRRHGALLGWLKDAEECLDRLGREPDDEVPAGDVHGRGAAARQRTLTESLHPPAAAPTAGSSGRGPWRSLGSGLARTSSHAQSEGRRAWRP
jgi:hypothetical protein